MSNVIDLNAYREARKNATNDKPLPPTTSAQVVPLRRTAPVVSKLRQVA